MIGLATALATIGMGLMSGIFLIFSIAIMPALSRIEPRAAIQAMQAINAAILNPIFLSLFMSLVVLGAFLVWASIWQNGSAAVAVAGFSYLLGVVLVTFFGNVPMNDELALSSAIDPSSDVYWTQYLDHWTRLNHVRTGACVVAFILLVVRQLL